jgi:tRNA modification GTPase
VLVPRYATFTAFRDSAGNLIDRGLALYFPRPNSFTGEDVAEFHLHGNRFVLELLVEDLCARGARLAEPGEFSARAFLRGKLDLAQAEALADLVNAASRQAARAAVASLEGKFSKAVNHIVHELTRLRVLVEANLDFADEDTGHIPLPFRGSQVATIDACIDKLLDVAKNGLALHEGCRVAIVGRPNAGKSSLLNAISRSDRAIVSDAPGTTRDLVFTSGTLNGLPVHLTDTAGLRNSPDAVEAEGIKRTHWAAQQADIVLLVVDACEQHQANELTGLLEQVDRGVVVYVVNKIDLLGIPSRVERNAATDTVYLSAKTGEGLTSLETLIAKRAGHAEGDGAFSARRRHIEHLGRARQALQPLRECASDLPDDLVAECLRNAQEELGRITGKVTSEDLLGEIFQTFCIGK